MLTLFMKIYGLLVLAERAYKIKSLIDKIAEYRGEEDKYLLICIEIYKLWKELRDIYN